MDFLLAFSQILGIIHVRNVSHAFLSQTFKLHLNFESAEHSYHTFLFITHKISHIFCFCIRWHRPNYLTVTTLINFHLTLAKINEKGFIFKKFVLM